MQDECRTVARRTATRHSIGAYCIYLVHSGPYIYCNYHYYQAISGMNGTLQIRGSHIAADRIEGSTGCSAFMHPTVFLSIAGIPVGIDILRVIDAKTTKSFSEKCVANTIQ